MKPIEVKINAPDGINIEKLAKAIQWEIKMQSQNGGRMGSDPTLGTAEAVAMPEECRLTGLSFKTAYKRGKAGRRIRMPNGPWWTVDERGHLRSGSTTLLALDFEIVCQGDVWEVESNDKRFLRETIANAKEAVRLVETAAHNAGVL